MKKSLSYFLLFIRILALSGCATTEDNMDSISTEEIKTSEKPASYSFEILEESKTNKILFENIHIDTLPLFQDSKGVKLSMDIDIQKEAFKAIKKQGFTAYFFDLSCETDCNLSYSSKKKVLNGKRFHINREVIFSSPGKRSIEYQFPFRVLEMKEGEHELVINVNAFPLKFKSDSSEADFRFIDEISSTPQEYIKLKIKVVAPKLYKAIVEVDKFALNTKVVNPQKFDFSMGGTGFPDLYWNIYCGEDLIYYSPQEKNCTVYNKKHKTKPFLCSKDDIIKINIADYDNGPFNTEDDIIETWTGKIGDLTGGKLDSTHLENLSLLSVKAKIIK